MSISHWGFFPGWFEAEFPFATYSSRAVWAPADWDRFWQITDTIERLK